MHTTEQLNTALAGRYAIERLIGEGGMATVYLARDIRHQRRVALKVLKPDLGAVVGVERFLSEIQVTANLQHPNLLPLFDSGAADQLLFYVMPYVEGESLRARLQREKQLPIDEAVRIAGAVGSALDYAHRHGVIHRDLKPENILLHEGQPLVADFGIALAVSNAGGNRITQTGLSLGTPQYMSPEQATGDRAIDGRTDIYSLGAVTYEMLTGEPPHTGSTSQAVIARMLTEKPRSIRTTRASVPDHIEIAVEQALEKLPADRWATAREFVEALGGARPVTRATSAGIVAGAPRDRRSTYREAAAWTIAVAALGGAAAVLLRPAPAAPPLVRTEFAITLPDSVQPRNNGSAASVAISADGSTIAFGAGRHREPAAIYVRRLDDRTVYRVPGTDSARGPELSPDGAELLYTVFGGANSPAWVKRISIRGGTARVAVDSAAQNGQVSWGDAGTLAVAFDDAIWTVPAAGGPRTLVARPDSSRRHVRYGFPDLLPGGRAAIITIWRGVADVDSAYIGIVTIPDGRVTELGIRSSYGRYSGTGHLVYVTVERILFAVPFDARSLETRGQPFPIGENVSLGTGAAAALAVARNGTIVYASNPLSGRGDRHLVAVDRGGAERVLTRAPGNYTFPRVSPDGRQVAFTLPLNISFLLPNPDIWRLDLVSGTVSRVTTDSQSYRSSWMPDGERIAFVRSDRDSVVLAKPLYATDRMDTLLRAPVVIGEFDPGPRGGYAVMKVRGRNGSDDVWIARSDSLGTARPFMTEAYTELMPRSSPVGNLVAYVSNRTGRNEVYVRPVEGQGEIQVSATGGAEPVWSRDGRELFYRSGTHLISARIVTRPRLAVERRDILFADDYAGSGSAVTYDVFPDGRTFLMIRSASTAGGAAVVVLTNWDRRRND